MFTTLLRPAVYGERIFVVVDSAPVFEVSLERSLNFPVLDQILDNLFQRAIGMALGFGSTSRGYISKESFVVATQVDFMVM